MTTSIDAVVGFVDLAGFTAAAETLGRAGSRGTERLRDLINELFTPVIDIVHDAGGEIGWFAGDAVGVVFDTAVTSVPQATAALARSAAAIEAMPPFDTPVGRVTLGVKVGIAAGPVQWQAIGDEDGDEHIDKHIDKHIDEHIVSWFGGAAVDLSSDAEGYCEPGDIVLHESVSAQLHGADMVEQADGFSLLRSIPMVDPPDEPSGKSALAERRSLAHQPPRVARLAQAGQAQMLDEHRPVTMIFQRLAAPVHDPEQLAQLRDAVGQLGGLLQLATEGDKGALVLALFGAPTALADRETRAVLAAAAMRDLVPGSQVGVASGRVYAGRVGSDARWDYSVIGDRVNTAARLMQAAAPGQVLVDEVTAESAGAGVVFDDGRAIPLKGKAEPETAFSVEGMRGREAPTAHLQGRGRAFVGRRAELETLLDRLDGSGVTVVVGRAGAGKSRILGRLVELAAAEPAVIVAHQTDRGRPFSLWRQLLPALVPALAVDDVPPGLATDERFPLLGPLLGRSIAESALTASIGREDRFELLASFVVELLGASDTTAAIVIEDLHWADDGSLQLLARISAAMAGAGGSIVASTRPDDSVAPLRSGGSVDEVALPPIDTEAMGELVRHLWRSSFGADPAASLIDDLVERSSGSPLFAEQLVAYALAAGVEPAATELPADGGIPGDLTDLLLARLDALPPDASTVATLGAVLRESFDVATLVGAFGDRYESTLIVAGLEELRDRGIVAGYEQHDFVHSLFAETAHDRLSYALLADLHLDVVQYLEHELGDAVDEQAADLARHTEHTDDADRKRRYYRLAGDQAAEQYAGEVAGYWYTRLVPLLDGADRGRVLLAHAEIESVSGDIAVAEQNLIGAIKDLDGLDSAPAELALARVLVKQGSTGAAFDLLDDLIERTEEAKAWGHLHAALDMKADVSTMLGDIERAEQVEAHHAALVEQHGPDHEVSAELRRIIPLHWLRGDLKTATLEYERLYGEVVQSGELVLAGIVASDLAGLSAEVGDTAAAFRWLDVALEMTERTGDRRFRCVVLSNAAPLRLQEGDVHRALETALRCLETAIQSEDRRGVAGGLRALGLMPGLPEELLLRSLVVSDVIGELTFVDVILTDLRVKNEALAHSGDASPETRHEIERLVRIVERWPELVDWEHRAKRLLQAPEQR